MSHAVTTLIGVEATPSIVLVITACVVCVALAYHTTITDVRMGGVGFVFFCAILLLVGSGILRLEA